MVSYGHLYPVPVALNTNTRSNQKKEEMQVDMFFFVSDSSSFSSFLRIQKIVDSQLTGQLNH